MEKTSENLLKLMEDFFKVKIEGKMVDEDVYWLYDEAHNYADSVADYWPDHKITVELKEEI